MSVKENEKLRLLIVDDEPAIRETMAVFLQAEGHAVETAQDGQAAVRMLGEQVPELVITDLRMPGMDGLELIGFLRKHMPGVDVIVITAYGDRDSAIQALRAGVYDYLTKPISMEDLGASVKRVAEKRALLRQNVTLRHRLVIKTFSGSIVGVSPAMQAVYACIRKISDSECNVLVTGESGTGKELVARAIHDSSPRFDGPFVVVDCGTLNENLLESELYGHVKGAFTGALYAKTGIFETAHGGTIFLDEIGATSPAFQSRLLRVIQEREFRKVGDVDSIKVDVRIISASNEDLEARVRERTFREDLYYRLNVVQIHLPPLRERKTDIPLLARFFLDQCAGSDPKGMEISQEAMDRLMAYDWPGNVRELQNVIERAVAFSDKQSLQVGDLPDRIQEGNGRMALPTDLSLKDMEKHYIEHILRSAGGHRGRAADILGISERTLYRKLHSYGIK